MNMLADLVAKMRKTSPAFSSLKSVTKVRILIDIGNTSPLTVVRGNQIVENILNNSSNNSNSFFRIEKAKHLSGVHHDPGKAK